MMVVPKILYVYGFANSTFIFKENITMMSRSKAVILTNTGILSDKFYSNRTTTVYLFLTKQG